MKSIKPVALLSSCANTDNGVSLDSIQKSKTSVDDKDKNKKVKH